MSTPIVSIIIPCYNQGEYLNEAIESVISQAYKFWECIIVNDGSNDDTENIAKEWCKKDKRISYVFQTNSGLSHARNKGIYYSKGKYILPLDADDLISNDYLELAISSFNQNPKLKLVYCKAMKFGLKSGNLILEPFSLYNLAKENMIFCTAFYKREDWDLLGGYDVNMKYGFEDWEFWINLLKKGGEVYQIDKCCFYYRIREKSMLRTIEEENLNYSFRYLSLKHAEFFIQYLGSFQSLYKEIKKKNNEIESLKKSRKLAVNILLESIFKRKLFKQ